MTSPHTRPPLAPEASSCLECLRLHLTSKRPASTAAPPFDDCPGDYRCPLREVRAIGRITDRVYKATWVALVGLVGVMVTAVLTNV